MRWIKGMWVTLRPMAGTRCADNHVEDLVSQLCRILDCTGIRSVDLYSMP